MSSLLGHLDGTEVNSIQGGDWSALPDVPVVSIDFYHVLYRKNKPLKSNLFLVSYHDYHFLDVSLWGSPELPCHRRNLSWRLTETSSSAMALTAPEMYSLREG